jgi:hypothetical protein
MATKNNIGRDVIPITIYNNSGYDLPLYLYLYGTTKPEDPRRNVFYLSGLPNGDCTQFRPNVQGATYGVPLAKSKSIGLFPQLDAIRAYISFERQLVIDTNEYGIPAPPSAENPGPNYYGVWDFFEATWHDYKTHTVLHVNTTQVDAFGLAFKVEHSGYDPANPTKPLTVVSGFSSETAWHDIFTELLAVGDPWRHLIVGPGRAIMPLKAIDLKTFPANQLDAYIKEVVDFYQRDNHLTFNYSGVNYDGTTTSTGSFVFVPDKAKDDAGRATRKYTIPRPTTRQCYAQNIATLPPADGPGGAICAALGASFLRATLKFYPNAGFPVPQKDRALYYTKGPICEYARIIHKHGIRNHAFCYGYDEVAGDAGENRDVFNPTGLTLTIQPIKYDAAISGPR